MENLFTVARQVAILFVLMGFGAAMRKAKLLSDKAIDGIVNLLILVVTPCLVIDVFQMPFDSTKLKGLGLAFAIGAVIHVIAILLARLIIRHHNENVRRPLQLAVVFSNAGFMGVPLEQAILGEMGVFYGIIYVVVFNLFIWSWGLRTMCVADGDEDGVRGRVKMLFNPGTVGLAVGSMLFLWSVELPAVIGAPIHHMANLNTPLAMIVIGHSLAGADFGKVLRTGMIYVTAVARLAVCPLLAITMLYPFRAVCDRDMMLATVIAASAPVAVMVSMFATKFRRDADVSVAVVSGTTILSILTMPVIIAFAMSVL